MLASSLSTSLEIALALLLLAQLSLSVRAISKVALKPLLSQRWFYRLHFFLFQPTVCGACYNMRLAGAAIIGGIGFLISMPLTLIACLVMAKVYHGYKWHGKDADKIPALNKLLDPILLIAPFIITFALCLKVIGVAL